MDGGGASLRGCGDGDGTAFEEYDNLGNISRIRSGIVVGHVNLLLRSRWLHATNC